MQGGGPKGEDVLKDTEGNFHKSVRPSTHPSFLVKPSGPFDDLLLNFLNFLNFLSEELLNHLIFYPFGQRTRRGRCPIEHRGEFPSVRPSE